MYWLSSFWPLSPSFLIASSEGMTDVSSWMMMDAEMYGMMFSAKIAMRCTAPPANMLKSSSTPWLLPRNELAKASGSMPGSGMYVPSR